MSVKKWVYLFKEVDQAEEYAGDWNGVRRLLGGKGANLAEMTRIGVPVPQDSPSALKPVLHTRMILHSLKICGSSHWKP